MHKIIMQEFSLYWKYTKKCANKWTLTFTVNHIHGMGLTIREKTQVGYRVMGVKLSPRLPFTNNYY